MYYRQSCIGWLICTGIICIFIGAYLGPLMAGPYYVLGGVLMLMVGLLIGYLKYRRGESVKNFKKRTTLVKRCPTCGAPLQRNDSSFCTSCGNNI